MKHFNLVLLAAIFFLPLIPSCSTPSYFGKSYAPTQNVDVYLDERDIEKRYEVIGTSEIKQGFNSLDKMQLKGIELGKAKGADGVIMILAEENTGAITNKFGNVKKGKKNDTYAGGTVTTNTKMKKILATFIKYK